MIGFFIHTIHFSEFLGSLCSCPFPKFYFGVSQSHTTLVKILELEQDFRVCTALLKVVCVLE